LAPPTNFDTTRVRFGEMIAAGSGLVLFLSLFLEWYNVSGKGTFSREASVGRSGWESLGFIDILLFLVAVIAVTVAVLHALNMMPRQLPASTGFILLVAGAIATLLVLFRLLSTGDAGLPIPGNADDFIDIGRSFGVFVAFLAALGVTLGGWLTWNEEGKPKPGAAGAGAGGPGAGAPLGQGQAPYGGAPTGGQPQQQAYTPPAAGAAPAAAAAPAAGAAPAAAGGAAKADWYPDPRGEKRLRYWDGSQWTDHTAD
jgi:hypothetical protein